VPEINYRLELADKKFLLREDVKKFEYQVNKLEK
jgi:hypothetical protein